MKNCIFAILFLAWNTLLSQYEPLAKNAFPGHQIQNGFDFWNISKPSLKFHSSFRPYLSSSYLHATDSALPFRYYGFRNLFFSKTFNEKPEKRNWFNFQILPIVDLEPGYDVLTDRSRFSSVLGSHIKLNINDDFTFAASVFGGQVQLPFFNDTVLAPQRILPETGQAYPLNNNGYAFSDFVGYLSYTTRNKVFNFQAGRDKHFIGDGYRSLLLSDFAPAYPYFRINTNIWRLQYSVWYAWMFDVTNARGFINNYTNKYGTFHYLSYNVTKEFNVGIFENIVWRGTDSNQVRTFEVNYLNPVIFYRPQEYSVGSPDNSFLGLNLNGILFKKIKLYGQLALDEFFLKELRARRGWWANKQGWQLGSKYINAFGIKGLKLQAEYNQVRPYTYTHGLVTQNYSHYGMPLAHPMGANFKEYLGSVSYRKNAWEIFWQVNYSLTGLDTTGTGSNMGQNIFLSYTTRPYEYAHYTTQGIRREMLHSHLRLTYLLVPGMNMRMELGYMQRSINTSEKYQLENPYVYLGFKTSFWNVYRDF